MGTVPKQFRNCCYLKEKCLQKFPFEKGKGSPGYSGSLRGLKLQGSSLKHARLQVSKAETSGL